MIFIVTIIAVIFYVNRINIYEPVKIIIRHGNANITKGVQLSAIKPLHGSIIISPDSTSTCWNIRQGYYKGFQIDFGTTVLYNNEAISIEIFSLEDNTKIISFQNIITKNNSYYINSLHGRNFFRILEKIYLSNYSYFVFFLTFLISLLTIYIIRKQKFLKVINYSIPIIFILWGFTWLILAAFYTFPNAEDLFFIMKSDNSEILNGPFQVLYNPGRYFANFLHGFDPLIWGCLSCYKLVPILTVFFMTFSLYFFIISIFRNLIKKRFAILFASFIVVFQFSIIPSIAYGLYWMAPCFEYSYSWILFFLWTGLFVRSLQSVKVRNKLICFTASVIFMFCSYGTNEMMLFLNAFALLVFAYIVFKYFPQQKHGVIALIIVAFACSFLIFSNGTIERFNSFESERNFQFFLSVFVSGSSQFFTTLFRWTFGNFSTVPLIIGSTLLINKYHKHFLNKISTGQILLLLVGLFLTMYAQPFVYYISMGADIYPERIYNFANWQFLIIIFFIIPILLIKLNIFSKPVFQKYHTQLLSFVVLVSLSQIIFGNNNLTLIRKEFCDGTYSAYKKQMTDRYEIIKNTKSINGWKCAEIDSIATNTQTIYSPPDIFKNRLVDKWNKSYEGYFMVDEVKIKGDTVSKLKTLKRNAEK